MAPEPVCDPSRRGCSFAEVLPFLPRSRFPSEAGTVAIIIRAHVADTKSFILNPQSATVPNRLCHRRRIWGQEEAVSGQR